MARHIPPPPRDLPRRVARPLPPHPYVPGRGPHPLRAGGHGGAGLFPNDPPELALARGLDLLAHHFPWEAHEAFEHAWRAWPPDDPRRRGAAGLVKIGAAQLKGLVGATRPARRLLEGAARDLEAGVVPDDVPWRALLRGTAAWVDGGAWPRWPRDDQPPR